MMSRSRTNGTLATLILAGGLIAGCGGSGGYTADQAAPTTTAPAASTTPPAAAPADQASSVVSAFPAEDPKAPTFKRFDRFPISEAGRIFVAPESVRAATASAPTAGAPTTATSGGGAPAPTAPTAPATTSGVSDVSGTPRTASVNVAQAEVDGAKQTLKKGDKVPAANPLFTVVTVEATKVTLKLNSGSFPGGSNTIDIAAGASVTLSNPTTGAAIAILVRSITPVAV